MLRRVSQVDAALRAKGMTSHQGDHIMYTKKVEGTTTLVTKISRSHREIGDGLGKLMAHQCALHPREFWQLIDCTLTEEEWDRLVRERCTGGRNPFLRKA
jgi:hypothetical protein